MSKREKPIQVEALTFSDSYDSLVDKHFRNRPSHRAEDSGVYDAAKMMAAFEGKVVRSRQEFVTSPSGFASQLLWASFCIAIDDNTYVTVSAKGNASSRGYGGAEDFKVTVIADCPRRASDVLADLRKQFLPVEIHEGPSFFIMTGRRPQRALLEEQHQLADERLALHYGEDFPAWCREFLAGLDEPGLSILRGEPGTGKTSFLRHVMSSLAATHRFYFVPVDNFDLLSSGSLTDFWKAEQREHPQASKVLVLEDAETLLLDREDNARNPVSNLLNLTDGLMTQYIKLHLLATLNCRRDDLDKALLRPGRLRFFKEFSRIPRERALRIAASEGLKLSDGSDFTLAEVFASAQFAARTSGAVKPKGSVGFRPD